MLLGAGCSNPAVANRMTGLFERVDDDGIASDGALSGCSINTIFEVANSDDERSSSIAPATRARSSGFLPSMRTSAPPGSPSGRTLAVSISTPRSRNQRSAPANTTTVGSASLRRRWGK